MGRERQKKKNRSSISKSRPKDSKRTKTGRRKVDFGTNTLLAKNWDRKLTLTQNYQRLGLSSRLGGSTGGTEKKGRGQQLGAFAVPAARNTGKLVPQEVQVERDPETGRIVRVLRSSEENEQTYNPLNDPLNELEDNEIHEMSKTSHGIIAELEREALEEEASLGKKRPRQQSQREEEWIARLVEKHGADTRAMARDKKLNPMQQTEGDITRRVRKWKQKQEAG